jgi:hypothetical protein
MHVRSGRVVDVKKPAQVSLGWLVCVSYRRPDLDLAQAPVYSDLRDVGQKVNLSRSSSEEGRCSCLKIRSSAVGWFRTHR